ncbi:MAG: metallophosphoesterase [Verrucomicrobiota bacterium]
MKDLIHYDIIGDIHGRFEKLGALMAKMGYRPAGDGFIPPTGHKALFLGDLIDPKPGYAVPGGVRATLRAVKSMIDAGHALSLMGNHELNAIFYHSKGSEDGTWIRPHNEKNVRMHEGTLADFPDHADPESEWRAVWLPWFKKLPFHLDMGSFRAVHATWHTDFISEIGDRNLENAEFFLAAANESKSEWEALETLLKGVEVDLPHGTSYTDHTGVVRNNMRAKWWELPAAGIHFDELVFPANPDIPNVPVERELFAEIPSYPLDAPPVFFGHYFKPADSALHPERANVACLDHSAAKEGPLVAYRWKGEASIKSEHYIHS